MSKRRSTRCTATTIRGEPCKLWAVRGTDPPLCAAHRGKRGRREGAASGEPRESGQGTGGRPDAPPAAGNDTPPGLEQQIEDLDRRIAGLGAYIDEHLAEFEPGELIRLLDLHSTMIGRASRVRAVRQRIAGGEGSELAGAINQALDALSKEWGIEL